MKFDVIDTPIGIHTFRLMTLQKGLWSEIQGYKLTRGRTCYAIIKEEFGLKGNREKVLAQFDDIVNQAKEVYIVKSKADG